ncbi:amino acid deaminase [Saccharopolyspora taberi]
MQWEAAVAVAGIDGAAVRALRDERIDWRFKGMPSTAFGRTVGEFLAQRPRIFESGFVGPLLVLDHHALEHNLRTMAGWCAEHGLHIAPHGKTTMAPQLFQRHFVHGAWGMTAANISQLRVYRAFGVRRVLLANELVDPNGLAWLAGELGEDFSVACWVDSVRGVELMTAALAGAARPLDVLVELGDANGRTGARTVEQAVEVARAVAASPALRLVGVAGYEAASAHDLTEHDLSIVDSYLGRVRELVAALDRQGYFADLDQVIVTSGGSSYFDQVAEALTKPWEISRPVVPVLRSGGYLTHDDGLYRKMSPFGRAHRLTGREPAFRSALRIWGQVVSRPEPDLALLTMGRRDVSFDQHLPEPQVIRAEDGSVRPVDWEVTELADQHAFLRVGTGARPAVGDWVGFGLSHPCTVFDKWTLIPVVDGDEVVDLVRTFF